MVIDMAVLGAIGIAASALSAGNHMVTHRRLRKLEKANKFRNVEVSVLEFGVLTSISLQIVDRITDKRLQKENSINLQNSFDLIENRINALNARIDAIRIDDIALQNKIIGDKVDHVSNMVDIAVMDDE